MIHVKSLHDYSVITDNTIFHHLNGESVVMISNDQMTVLDSSDDES